MQNGNSSHRCCHHLPILDERRSFDSPGFRNLTLRQAIFKYAAPVENSGPDRLIEATQPALRRLPAR